MVSYVLKTSDSIGFLGRELKKLGGWFLVLIRYCRWKFQQYRLNYCSYSFKFTSLFYSKWNLKWRTCINEGIKVKLKFKLRKALGYDVFRRTYFVESSIWMHGNNDLPKTGKLKLRWKRQSIELNTVMKKANTWF